ncbi:MAG: RNA pyrophosphohydrolase [Agarilytica sp.]
MIDQDGFRPNVGIILANDHGRLLWARRLGGQDAWQFPQGGIKRDEDPEVALYRELEEEIGLSAEHVDVLGVTKGWLRYRLPKKLVRSNQSPVCVGQKQKWFLLRLRSDESHININFGESPEFDKWEWVSYWYPLSNVVSFKREVYRKALKELVPVYNQQFANRFSQDEEVAC